MNYPVVYDPNINSRDRYDLSLVSLIVFIAAVFAYTIFCIHGGLFSDEGFHAPQIWVYYSGGTTFAETITVPPTYHYIIGFIVRQIGYYDDNLLKLISLLISLLTIPVFYKLISKYHPQEAGIRTLQLFFLPLMFIYYFLIYTDIWALLLISLNLYFALNKRYALSALIGLAAICLRQDSIIWVGFSFLLICFEKTNQDEMYRIKTIFKNGFVKGAPYIAIFFAFIAFVIYNGGVAIGDKDQHNSGSANFANFYIFLILAWFLYLPLNIKLLPDIISFLRNHWNLALITAGFLLYMGSFTNPHGYNNSMFDYFLHNGMAHYLTQNILVKSISYILAIWMLLSLVVMKLPEQRFKWALLVIPLAVISHPMIEPRYYFPAYLTIHLLRPALSPAVETGTLVCYILLAAYIVYGSVSGHFFL
ncbi:MAG TPA: hypothetical protein VLF09_07060 [Cellvibrio sp.]|nr:hypothetical protein [Cellvibrio sp.]